MFVELQQVFTLFYTHENGSILLIYTSSIMVSVMSIWSQFQWVRYISMEREHLQLLFKDDLSQIMLIIILISSWIINELEQILANLCKK